MTRSNDTEGQKLSISAQPDARRKQPYKAYEISSEEKRYLEFRPKHPDPAECPSYSLLTYLCAEWRSGQSLHLEFGTIQKMTMMVIIEGENLTELFRALKTWTVEWIAEFSPYEHEPPTDSNAPFIRAITIHTSRPEASPPPNQRH